MEGNKQGLRSSHFFGWFSNWSPEGPIRKGYLASLPDSIDMVSMWSGPFGLNEAKLADKEIFQKKKGGKITVCYILHNIGTGITPTSVSEKVQAENPEASSEEINELVKRLQKNIGALPVERRVRKITLQRFKNMQRRWWILS